MGGGQRTWGHYQLALCELQVGDLEAAERRAAEGRLASPGSVLFHSIAGLVAALRGDAPTAREAVELVEANRRAFGHYHHAQYDVACIWAVLGERDLGLAALAAAADNGFPCRDFFAVDPLLAGLRETAGFAELLADLELRAERWSRTYREAGDGRA